MEKFNKLNKLESFLIVLAIILFTACAFGLGIVCANSFNSKTKTEEPTTEVATTSTEESTLINPVQVLTDEYRACTWDGTERVLGKNTYYIDETGILTMSELIDGIDEPVLSGEGCPDAPDFIRVRQSIKFEDGVVVINSDFTDLMYCVRGEVVSSHALTGIMANIINGQFELASFDDVVVLREGQHMVLYEPLKEWQENTYDGVIDFKIAPINDGSGLDKLVYSKANGPGYENFEIRSSNPKFGEPCSTHYTKFPGNIEEEELGLSFKGRIFYVGTGVDQKYYYLVDNDDGGTYTLCYKDLESNVDKTISKRVVDAEGTTLGCYFIATDGNTYFVGVDSNPKVVFNGTAYALTPAVNEEDAPCILTTEEEANLSDSNGWDYLYNPVHGR